ncbi:hypothetical protein BD289DRAFT_33579 [Coniella lustricola]|uniref:HMG box domain-containing protein n=1 Tax=Coniella lustricola TaxID=2025994 RepID=A0A2T3A2J4_9PEZI|nr:hypothetical protein BD289DRAFT_33579 [Coniella lustricola]
MSSSRLAVIFGELGITQYLDAFVDQGFDSWETILDITESDLDALNVKLGHRRKLQRRIANARGIAPTAILVSPNRPAVEETRNDVHRPDTLTSASSQSQESAVPVVQKRKYRRHPKPDENAPERPPSAYVLFSNKMRDDLKGQNLTFTEIAKLVGENWQGLSQTEKEPFERQAQNAKEKYNNDLAQYKKTPEYKKYTQYLQDFKAKHGTQSHDKENAKRVRLSETVSGEPNGIPSHISRVARNGSLGDEPSARRHRIDSLVSNGESYYASSVVSTSQRSPGEDSTLASPNTGYFERRREHSPSFAVSPRDGSSQPPVLPTRRDPVYADGSHHDVISSHRHLPSFSDMLDGRSAQSGVLAPGEAATPKPMLPIGHMTVSPSSTPTASACESRPPSLKQEQSSAGSISSGSSYNSYPRTPVEGPMPIHALLTGGKQFNGPDPAYGMGPAMYRSMSPDERALPAFAPLPERHPSDSILASHTLPQVNGSYYHSHPSAPKHIPAMPPTRPGFPVHYHENRPSLPPVTAPHVGISPVSLPALQPSRKSDTGLDGISALLQADKIADRRST